jgi:L-2-hydroxyglutarate oxidase LhgO
MADTPLSIVGAGVVGLAIAARLARRFPELVILERHERYGSETSSRNSEVIHGGMYYPAGSLKARLCVRGKHLLYELCERAGVPHRRTGKLIVAMETQETQELERLLALGRANAVELELVGIERRDADYRLEIRTPDGTETLTTERVVNAAGLESDRVAALAGIDVDAAGYRLHWWKGSYFAVSGSKAGLLSRLVYPVPSHVSLGVHAVLGLEGRLRFGPDAEHLPQRQPDYSVDEAKRDAFAEGVHRLVPAIDASDLAPDIAGIRPKLQGPGEGFRDFVIAEEAARGLPGFVNLIGIDSPGLTSAPAIAEEVERLLA